MEKMKKKFSFFFYLFEAFENKEHEIVYLESRDRISIIIKKKKKPKLFVSSDLKDA